MTESGYCRCSSYSIRPEEYDLIAEEQGQARIDG